MQGLAACASSYHTGCKGPAEQDMAPMLLVLDPISSQRQPWLMHVPMYVPSRARTVSWLQLVVSRLLRDTAAVETRLDLLTFPRRALQAQVW